jgi:hypothetical protein
VARRTRLRSTCRLVDSHTRKILREHDCVAVRIPRRGKPEPPRWLCLYVQLESPSAAHRRKRVDVRDADHNCSPSRMVGSWVDLNAAGLRELPDRGMGRRSGGRSNNRSYQSIALSKSDTRATARTLLNVIAASAFLKLSTVKTAGPHQTHRLVVPRESVAASLGAQRRRATRLGEPLCASLQPVAGPR